MTIREKNRLKHRESLPFVNKKKQKNFVNWSVSTTDGAPGPNWTKVFCFFLSKKMLPSFH